MFENELAYPHSRTENNVKDAQVKHLKLNYTTEAGVYGRRGNMYSNTKSSY